ncbi:response regulator [Aggregatimonas sangjinii]|uniref:Response regulator n=1 Tax=Aggregatimonas sangjinii TaxID=2583587 RepID=A0A5B7SRP5_9FLAO|nr:response regulator [Aggregatimonas sangjinii]QCX01286.1 response regulator [Aggregatimonas sangjinii]
MKNRLRSIMLLDDNPATNFIHKKFIKMAACAEKTVDFQSGNNALKYLQTNSDFLPDIIFVDINMPIMSAWEFLEEYGELVDNVEKKPVVILLSTSLSPADKKKAEDIEIIDDIRLKPLAVDVIHDVVDKFFPSLP